MQCILMKYFQSLLSPIHIFIFASYLHKDVQVGSWAQFKNRMHDHIYVQYRDSCQSNRSGRIEQKVVAYQ